jgi:hypothetical protein
MVTECRFKSCTEGGVVIAGNKVNKAVVTNNIFQDITSTGQVWGVRFGTDSYANQDDMSEYIITGNHFSNITTTANDTDVQAILVYGQKIVITDNIIDNVANGNNGTNCEGIYGKARYATISNNVLKNAGGDQGAIAIKGSTRVSPTTPQGFTRVVSGNVIIWDNNHSNAVGVYVKNTDVLITGNLIDGASYAAVYTNEQVTDGEGLDATGLEKSHGILVEPANTTINTLSIKSNLIKIDSSFAGSTYGSGITVIASAAGYITSQSVIGNHIENLAAGALAFSLRFNFANATNATVMNNSMLTQYGASWNNRIFMESNVRPTRYHIIGNADFPDESNLDSGFRGILRGNYVYTTDPNGTVSVGTARLPPDAIITRSWYNVTVQPDSAGDTATLSLGHTGNDEEILAPVSEDNAAWTVGWHDGLQDGTATNFTTKTTAPVALNVVIANEDLTAGNFDVYVEYMIVP